MLLSVGAGLALRVLGALFAFGLSVMIARLLGAEGAGYYFLSLSVITIFSAISKIGIDKALLKFVAVNAAQERWDQVNKEFKTGLVIITFSSLSFSFAVFYFAPFLANSIFNMPEMTGTLNWMSFGILTLSLMTLLAECLKGIKQISLSMIVSSVLLPVTSLSALIYFVNQYGQEGAAISYILGSSVSLIFGLAVWLSKSLVRSKQEAVVNSESLWSLSIPLWIMSVINRAILPWAPLLILGVWGSAGESGVFGAATRIAVLMSFFLMAVNSVLAPRFASLYAEGEIVRIGFLIRKFTRIITLVTLPFFVLLILFGDKVMGIFGDDFKDGWAVLSILIIGQFINTLTGSVSSILTMTGHQKDTRDSALAGMVTMVVLAFLLIPSYTVIGAAVSSSLAVVVANVYATICVWKRLGIIAVPFLNRV